MGFTKAIIRIGALTQENGRSRFEKLAEAEALVDTGATYSCLPSDLLRQTGAKETRKVALTLADGRKIERGLGYVWLEIEGSPINTPVVFGEEADPVLVGVIALEDANLSVDPVTRRLLKGTSYIQY